MIDILMNKTCSKCKRVLNTNDFHKDSSKKGGIYPRCKKCRKKVIKVILSKECIQCNIEKDIKNNFTSSKGRLCKECKIRNRKNYREKNCRKEYRKKYIQQNKQKVRESQNKSKRYRRKHDKLYKLKSNISNLIKETFKRSGNAKNSSTNNILGCSIDFFRNHIESQFLDWMNWDNYGNCETNEYKCSWHLDHIIPASSAKDEKEILLLNHWSNFQPLCSKRNMLHKRDNIPNVFNTVLERYSIK